MSSKVEVTEFLYSFKGIIDSYNKVITLSAAKYGMTKPEADILLFFSNHPQYTTAKDAVDYRGFSKGYVSKALESLIRKGFMEMKVDAKDRRCQQLYVTSYAGETVKELQEVQKDFFSRIESGIPKEQIRIQNQVMKQYLANAEEIMNEKNS